MNPSPRHRLIVALDQDADGNRRLVRDLGDAVAFYKLGAVSMFSGGATLLAELQDLGKNVFLDLKLFDVPNTVEHAVRRVAELGVQFATVHGTKAIVQAAREGRRDSDLKILAVTALTSLTGRDISDLYGLPDGLALEDYVIQKTRLLVEAGCDGVISSPREVAKLRHALPTEAFLIVAPGIRMPGDAAHDQVRTGDPYETVRDGADYVVMGRSIYGAPDPRSRVEEAVSEIRRGLDARAT